MHMSYAYGLIIDIIVRYILEVLYTQLTKNNFHVKTNRVICTLHENLTQVALAKKTRTWKK